MKADDISLFFLNTLYPYLFYLLPMITHAAGLGKFLGKIRSPVVVYNLEEEYYIDGGGMGVTSLFQHKMEISNPKPTSKYSANKVRIFRIEEVDFCNAFLGGLPGKGPKQGGSC